MPHLLTAVLGLACLSSSLGAQTDPTVGAQPLDPPFQTERFEFDVAGQTLVGLLDRPTGRDPSSTVILVHGYGETDVAAGNGYYDLRARLARVGVSTLVWDKPGCGQSGGEFDIDQPVQSSADEVVAAARALGERGFETGPVGLWGISRAGWVAPLAMRDEPDLAFWISVSGPDGKENARYLLRENFRIEGRPPEEVQTLVGEWQARFNTVWQDGTYQDYLDAGPNLDRDPFMAFMGWSTLASEDDFYSYQEGFRTGNLTVDEDDELMVYVPGFASLLASIRRPVLALFGEDDSNVDWRRTAKLYRETVGASADASLTIRVFPGANHNIKVCRACGVREMTSPPWDAPYAEGYHDTIADWLVANSFGER
ncbi:alpha/beta hydrolase family protein [Rubrivirga sp.]|uniref:alpha/beta hydrolase family protein n=1 Tax=Rubrivirga sp. TaxID=1885344 RepID=UPI003C76B917